MSSKRGLWCMVPSAGNMQGQGEDDECGHWQGCCPFCPAQAGVPGPALFVRQYHVNRMVSWVTLRGSRRLTVHVFLIYKLTPVGRRREARRHLGYRRLCRSYHHYSRLARARRAGRIRGYPRFQHAPNDW